MKLKGYIHAQYDEWAKEYSFHLWSQDMSSQEHCGPMIEVVEIDFTPPPREVLINGSIANFRQEQKKIRAEAEMRCNQIEEAIQSLLCIEHKAEVE